MPGIITRPRAATVAGPEPEMAAKKQETMTHTMARPPRRWPTQVSARRIRRLEIWALSMMLPARMKKGMASSTNLLVDEENSWGRLLMTVSRGRPAPWMIMEMTLETPRQTAMGAPISSRTAKLINRTAAIMYQTPPFLPRSSVPSPERPSVPERGPGRSGW